MAPKHRRRNGARGVPPRSFVTADEVARLAGVSRSAVSRTFTPGASVSREVRECVTAAADRLGYRVNRLARGLISARSNLVGIVGTTIESPFHGLLLAGLSDALQAEGFDCMLFNAAHAGRDLGALIERLLEYRVSAIVVMSGMPPSWIIEEAIASGVPVILINRAMPGLTVDAVVTDPAAGGREAARRLIASGCRNLAVVASGERTFSLRGRLQAFCSEATAANIPVAVWEKGSIGYDAGWQAGLALLADDAIDGAFCVTDMLALGFLDAVRRRWHRRVPRDLSVIGFDDIPQAGWDAYRLTTFRQVVPDLTRAVVAAVKRRASERDAPAETVVLPPTLVQRDTLAEATKRAKRPAEHWVAP
ncbi:MAG: LacI family DNA-binding transcriptional regulator [Proteobacteria bacterium]|nr:LacI family DNA-binding transcriptional regulator [Pseudomonadota bacterium]